MDPINIIECCQRGDADAFNELYKLYNAKASRTAYLISGHRGIAEDIVQEAFIQCFLGIKHLRKPDKFSCWFYSILVRSSWKAIAKHKNNLPLDDYHDYGQNCKSVEEIVEAKDIHKKVQEIIDKLSVPLKTVVVLYYYEEMSISEISKILGCFEGTVKSRLHNARKLIGKGLSNYDCENSSMIMFQRKECTENA